MNDDDYQQTTGQAAEQKQATEENLDYWKTEAPLLASSLARVSPGYVSGEQTQAEGQAAAGVRAQVRPGLYKPNRFDEGAGSGSSADILSGGNKILAARGGGADAVVDASNKGKGLYINRVNALSGAGSQLVAQGNSALDTGARIQAGLYQENVANKSAEEQEVTSAISSIGSMGGGMGGMGGMAGGAGGGGGGGGG